MDTTCPTCRAEPGSRCRRPNAGDLRPPHTRRLINTVNTTTIRLLWRTLPPSEQLLLLADLPVNDGRRHPASSVSLYTMPPSDPGHEWRDHHDRLNAARDLIQRARKLLELARHLQSHPFRTTGRPSSRR